MVSAQQGAREHLRPGRQQLHGRRPRLRGILQAAQAAQRLAQHRLLLGAGRGVHDLRAMPVMYFKQVLYAPLLEPVSLMWPGPAGRCRACTRAADRLWLPALMRWRLRPRRQCSMRQHRLH